MENTNVIKKDVNVEKINSLGSMSKVVLNIVLAVLIIGTVISAAFGVYLLTLPNDAVTISGNFDGSVSVSEDVPEKLIKFEENDLKIGKEGNLTTFSVKERRDNDNRRIYDIKFLMEKLTGYEVKIISSVLLFVLAISFVILIIIAVFAKKLAIALEKCDSPFEENVLNKMKSFGFSLIPWAIFKLVIGNVSGLVTILFILAFLMFIRVFAYGAKLQKESDETL